MSLKSTQKVATNRHELVITVDGATFADAIQKAYRQNVGKIQIQGFRKGKAPKAIIEKFYGKEVFYEDALNILYPDAVEGAIAESGLEFVDDKIDFDMISIGEEGVEFKVVITVKPEVEIEGYKGLKAEKVKVAVDDAEVEEEINRMRERNSRLVTVEDRAAQEGDIAVIDFEGFVDEVAFEGGKGESYSLTLGSGQFIPGFEEQVAGHNVGEEFDVNVTFPEDYQAEDLKGKAAVFKCKLHEVKMREYPEVDDEFAKDVSEFETLEALKEDIKAKALERKTRMAENEVETDLMEQVAGLMKAEIPEAMFDKRADQKIEEFGARLQSQGMDLDTYMKFTGATREEMKKTFLEQAQREVKVRLALEQIVKNEGIEVSEDELNAEYEKLAKDYSIEVDRVKAFIPAKDLSLDLAVSKAADLVKDSAEITEVEKKAEKAE